MKIAIIGAGPAGIYSTLLLRDLAGEVHLFEQNADVGEKLKTTGGGRMNVTNKVFTDTEFTSHDQRWVERLFKNPHFENRYSILAALGIEYVWEKNRAILKSQNAVAEVARLKNLLLAQPNAQVHLNTKITAVVPDGEGFSVHTENDPVGQKFDRVILTIGGMYRMKDMGPIEKIYALPQAFEHEITSVKPSLCPLIFKDKALRPFAGINFVGCLNDKASGRSVTDDLLIMTGDVRIKSKVQGEMRGEKITMNLKTKEIKGEKSQSQRVKLIIKSKKNSE